MNDYDGTVLDMNENKPKSRVLDILKNNGQLDSVMTQLLSMDRYSDWWDSDSDCTTASQMDYSMIDHILVTDYIKKNINNSFIYHGYKEYCGKYNSDHFPVVIDLLI